MTVPAHLNDYQHQFVWHWKLILGILVFSGLGGVGLTYITPTLYGATARVTITATDVTLPPMMQLAIFQSDAVAVQTLRDLNHIGLGQNETSATLVRNVRVSSDLQDRTVFRVAAQASTPQQAAILANLWAKNGAQEVSRQYYAMRRGAQIQKLQLAFEHLSVSETTLDKFLETNKLTRQQIASVPVGELPRLLKNQQALATYSTGLGLTIDQTAELARVLWDRQIALLVYTDLAKESVYLDIVSQFTADDVFVIDAELPYEPLQPKPLVNLVIALVAGLIGGILISFMAEYFTRYRSVS